MPAGSAVPVRAGWHGGPGPSLLARRSPVHIHGVPPTSGQQRDGAAPGGPQPGQGGCRGVAAEVEPQARSGHEPVGAVAVGQEGVRVRGAGGEPGVERATGRDPRRRGGVVGRGQQVPRPRQQHVGGGARLRAGPTPRWCGGRRWCWVAPRLQEGRPHPHQPPLLSPWERPGPDTLLAAAAAAPPVSLSFVPPFSLSLEGRSKRVVGRKRRERRS